jgi:hypothetical protein
MTTLPIVLATLFTFGAPGEQPANARWQRETRG